MLTSLAGLGIHGFVTGGKITLQGDGQSYITSMSSSLQNVLKLSGTNYSTSTATVKTTLTSNTTNATAKTYNTTNTLTTDDTLALHGLTANASMTIVQDGVTNTLTVKTTDTIDDLLTSLAGLGIHGFVTGGKITLQGDGQSYITSMSSTLQNVLKLSNTNYSTSTTTVTTTYTSNTTSNQKVETIITSASGATKLQDLRHENGDVISGYQLILSTTSDAGNNTVTVNFNATDDVYSVIDKLAEHGINASIDSNGKFSVHSSSLTDFSISGTLGNFIMGSYTKLYDQGRIDSVSTNLIQETIVNMDDDTLLSKINITNGNILLYNDGTTYTIAIDNTKTVGDFRNILAEYGVSSEIINGQMQLLSDGVVYLKTVTGGSNLVDILGLDITGTGLGDYSQKSKYLTDTETIVHSATMDDKLSELTDSAGNDLGVSAGNIYVYQDGTRNLLYINTGDTLQDLANKLSQYGISMDISSDGKIYLAGNNNSYLTTQGISSGASNILTKFNIQGDWNNRYNSTSETLDYEVVTVEDADGDTKLVDLVDESGNSLGIDAGSYYVYQNGVRTTEEITDDTTLNDFRATMALYGISTDIDQNSSMHVGGYNQTYLATSNTGGDDTNAIAVLFEQWNFVNVYTSNNLEIPQDVTVAVTETTKLADINEGDPYQAGYITVVKDGVKTNIELTANDTIGDLIDELALYGFESVINANGQLIIKNTGNSTLEKYSVAGQASNALELLGIGVSDWINTNTYEGTPLSVITTTTETIAADRDTLLSDLIGLGITTGEYYIYNNGVKYTALISSDETIGSLMDTLASFGIQANLVSNGTSSVISIAGNGESYVAKSDSVANASNVVEKLFIGGNSTSYNYASEAQKLDEQVTSFVTATEATLLSEFDNTVPGKKAEGDLIFNIDGTEIAVNISATETIGSFINKLQSIGLNAMLSDGDIIIESGYSEITIASTGTSGLLETINLRFNDDLGGYASSSVKIDYTETIIEDKTLSVANYADDNTTMNLLNISSGSLTVYRNGEKATIQITENQTFGDLKALISSRFSDVKLDFEEGFLRIYSDTDNVSVEVGSTTDTSNFSAITGIASDGNGDAISARELYCVNSNSKLINYVQKTTKLSALNISDGSLTITNNGVQKVFAIDSNKTFKELEEAISNEFSDVQIELNDGLLKIYSTLGNSISIGKVGDTSNFKDKTNLKIVSSDTLTSSNKLTIDIFRQDAVREGTFKIGDETFEITDTTRLTDLISQINASQKTNATAYWDSIEGKLVIQSRTTGAALINIEAGTSNFTDIMGLTNTEWDCKSQTINASEKEELLSSLGVTAGTFEISRKYKDANGNDLNENCTITINNDTKIKDLIENINNTGLVEATWDNSENKIIFNVLADGKFNFVNGTSNALDILGLNTANLGDADSDGKADITDNLTRINTNTQEIGDNAKFSINGTYYTSTKNEIGSDVSRIKGLTINLKGISEGEETTITVERDKETVANAVSDVVDAYNELIENIDKEIAKDQPLADQFTLKLIRNQVRSLMTGTLAGNGIFKNLDAIGVSLEKASANNINTTNINTLYFDKDKFMKAFDADRDAIKTLLVGTDTNRGIFQQVEDIIEQAVTTGYFSSAERSYSNQISRLDSKIEKAQKAVERYKEQLEAKFASMDLLISKMQNQYSSFLGV